MNKPTRGGKRAGAGRKPRTTPLQAITVRIEPDAADKLKAICKATGKSQAGQVAEWIKNHK